MTEQVERAEITEQTEKSLENFRLVCYFSPFYLLRHLFLSTLNHASTFNPVFPA
jgi:hypothetical protein